MYLGVTNTNPAFGINIKSTRYMDKSLLKALRESSLVKEIDARYPNASVEFIDHTSKLDNAYRRIDSELKFKLAPDKNFTIVGVGNKKNHIDEIVEKLNSTSLLEIRKNIIQNELIASKLNKLS